MSSPELQIIAPARPARRLIFAALVACVGQSGCLKLNLDYGYPVGANDPREDGTQPSSGQATQQELSTQPPSTSNPTQDPNASVQAPTSTADTSESQSSPTTTLSSSDSSTSTSTETSEPGPGSRWIPITVRNPISNGVSTIGTSVSLSFDHAALVAGGARADAEDLRVYTLRSGTRTQLHRVLDPESSWGRSDTTIWFRTDAGLSESQTETNVYHLVIDANTNNPAQDPQGVFLFFDDFNAPNPSLERWSVEQSGIGAEFATEVTGGQLVLSARPTINNVVRNTVRASSPFSVSGVVVEASVGWDGVPGRDGCTEETVIGMWSPNTFEKRAVWNRRDDQWYFAYEGSSGSDYHRVLPASPIDGSLRRHAAYWVDYPVSMYTDGEFAGSLAPNLSGFRSPDFGPLQLGFAAGVDGAICARASRVRVDWVYARAADSVFEIETTPRFADEFVQP